jgi:gas vesicle protein
MRVLFSFVAGMLVGVVGALLFAPTSGEELRTQLREGAEAEYKKALTEWERGSSELQAKVDEVNQQLRTLIEQARAPQEAAEEPEAEPAA